MPHLVKPCVYTIHFAAASIAGAVLPPVPSEGLGPEDLPGLMERVRSELAHAQTELAGGAGTPVLPPLHAAFPEAVRA